MTIRTGFIGLGNMGKPVAMHLAPAGFETIVFDIDEEPVAELVAGGAKVDLSQFEMSLGMPSMITGRNHAIKFPSNIRPICVGFGTPWGPLSLEVGLDLPKES